MGEDEVTRPALLRHTRVPGVEWPTLTAFSCSLFSMVASCTSTSSPPSPTSCTSSLLSHGQPPARHLTNRICES